MTRRFLPRYSELGGRTSSKLEVTRASGSGLYTATHRWSEHVLGIGVDQRDSLSGLLCHRRVALLAFFELARNGIRTRKVLRSMAALHVSKKQSFS
jgi:hypothetical protein